MRTRTFYMGMIMATLLGLTACRKEVSTENGNGSVVGEGSFTAYIDGSFWEAADTAKQASLLGGLTNLIGISADGQQLSITLPDTVVGTYPLDQNSISTAVFTASGASGGAYSSNQGADTSQAGGTVIVTGIDRVNKTISGTFSFKLYRESDGSQKKFTKGVFNKLPYIDSLPTADSSDTLYADIDNIHWKAESILASAFSGQIAINGSTSTGDQSIGLVFPQDVTPGSYPMDYTQFTYFGLYTPIVNVGLASASGTLQILENNSTTHRVKGKFDFKAVNPLNAADLTHQLTNGYFSVGYN